MSENSELVDRLKEELRSSGTISETGLALFTMKGKILYSDLANDIEQRLMLFKPSFPGLTIGSNITLAAEEDSVIVIRTSKKMLMAVQTQQRVGFTLVMLSTLIKRYEKEFDKYAKTITKLPKAIAAEAPVTEAPAEVVAEVEAPPAPVTEAPAEVVAAEAVEEVEGELTEEELGAYQKSLIYELIPPLTPENVLDKSGVWNRASRLMLRNLDQDLTVDELREGLTNAGFDVTWQWVFETLRALETRGTVRIKGKREE
ncbi:MAG: hypothetical protein ACETWM_18010 [Candidatus Lokiarchaeia archaeon]